MLAIRVMSTVPCTRGGLISVVHFDIMRKVWIEATKPKKNLQTKTKNNQKKRRVKTNPEIKILFARIFALHHTNLNVCFAM